MYRFMAFALLFACATCVAQVGADQNLQAAVNAGNQAWIDGMRSGNTAAIAAIYTPDAVNCTAEGQCVSGLSAIDSQFRSRMASTGRAQTANVRTTSLTRDADLAYEWGYAEANFGGNRMIRGRYLTVWQRQSDGGWKILRNISLPEAREGRQGRPARGSGYSARTEQSFAVRCESDDMGRHTCAAPTTITRAEVSRQISGSPCTQDRTWGWQGNSIWVDRGCRAEFTVYGYATEAAPAPQPVPSGEAVTEYNDPNTKTLRCESTSMNYQLCPAGGTVRGARLVRQLSGSACTETQTWGWKSDGVWVDKGCRAEFEVTVR